VVTFSAKVEAELAELPPEDRAEFLESLGLAGVIHSDFEKGFIRAETVAYDDFVRLGGWKPAREQGLARAEGKEYVVQDGDVMLFRFSS
jgi:ribosome-binding ATPase YchF (GTP1/OBG family)